ncbi:MAG: glycosyltransferase family 2 protein [Candidatus Kapaibacteriota bacterium]
MVDLVIISYNGKSLTAEAIESAIANTLPPSKIIVVDNNSSDGSVEYLKDKFKQIEIVPLNKNYGYGKAANLGVQKSTASYVVISNNDVIFPKNFFEGIRNLIHKIEANLGIIGFQQIYPDGLFQNSYGKFHTLISGLLDVTLISLVEIRIRKLRWKFGFRKVREVDYVDGAVICVNKSAFAKVGGFDENFFFYSEEVDLAKRMKGAGFKVFIDENNVVIHYRGQGANKQGLSLTSVKLLPESRALYCKKHLPTMNARFYMFLQAIYYKELSILLRLKKMFSTIDVTEQISLTDLISKEFWRLARKYSHI